MANAIFTAPAVARSGTLGSVRVEPLTRSIGALLENVSLADAARDDVLFAEIRALLLQHQRPVPARTGHHARRARGLRASIRRARGSSSRRQRP